MNNTIETRNEAMVGTTAHRWEVAGLGRAPYRFMGCDYSVGPIRMVDANGFTWEIGAPGQPMGSCDFCGQGIALICTFKSADGKTFKVGCDCAEKSGDAGIVKYASAARREHNRKMSAARKEKKTAELVAGAETTHAAILARLDRLASQRQPVCPIVRWRRCQAAPKRLCRAAQRQADRADRKAGARSRIGRARPPAGFAVADPAFQRQRSSSPPRAKETR